MNADKPGIGSSSLPTACGVIMLVLPSETVSAMVEALGMDPASPTGNRLNGGFHILGLILAIVGGRRLYMALKKK